MSLVVVLWACQSEPVSSLTRITSFTKKDFVSLTQITSDILTFEIPFAKPVSLICLNDRLMVVIESAGSHTNLIKVLDLRSGQLVQQFGKQGRGPGEFMDISSVHYSETEQRLDLYDGIMRRFTQYSLAELTSATIPDQPHIIDLTTSLPAYDFLEACLIGDHTVCGVAMNNQHQILVCDKNRTVCLGYGELKEGTADPTLPENILENSMWLAPHPTAKRVAFFMSFADVLGIIDLDKKALQKHHGPDQFSPVYPAFSLGNGLESYGFTDDTRNAYNGIVTSDRYIWGLYSGRHVKQYMTRCFYVHVFDWSGNPLHRYELDQPLSNFCLMPNGKGFYGITYDENSEQIVRFDVEEQW